MFPEDCNCSQLLNVQIMSKNMALGKFNKINFEAVEGILFGERFGKQINFLKFFGLRMMKN